MYILTAQGSDMSNGWLCADNFEEQYSMSFPYWMYVDSRNGILHVNAEADEVNILDITIRAKADGKYIDMNFNLTIDPNATNDFLYGTSGNDLFDFSTLSDSTANNMDTIMDFEQGHDKLDFTDLGFDESDIGSHLLYEIVNGDTIIHDTESEFAVKLHGEHQLLASDYIL
jgi:hypothetical protein